MNTRPHIRYIDGLRGLAALYVVIFHVFDSFREQLPGWMAPIAAIFDHGHAAVGVFIVISGFCLALPLTRPGAEWTRASIPRFAWRRAHRILPPYYFAFLLTMLGLLISSESIAFLKGARNSAWLENFDPLNLVSHLFLFHNWTAEWAHGLNAPFWSIGTEWQIYFVFALVLAPLIVKRQWPAAYAVGLVLTGAALLIFGSVERVVGACPWYVILFTFGAHAAMTVGGHRTPHLWRWLAIGAFFLVLIQFIPNEDHAMPFYDFGVGALAAAGLLFLANPPAALASVGKPLLAFLEHPATFALGAMSYSLYLTHGPILGKLRIWINAAHLPPVPAFWSTLIINIPITVAAAYVFYFFCEKPFLNRAPKAAETTPKTSLPTTSIEIS